VKTWNSRLVPRVDRDAVWTWLLASVSMALMLSSFYVHSLNNQKLLNPHAFVQWAMGAVLLWYISVVRWKDRNACFLLLTLIFVLLLAISLGKTSVSPIFTVRQPSSSVRV
jgi:hypothetical protein